MPSAPSIHCQSCDSFMGNIFCALSHDLATHLDQKKLVRDYQKKQNLFFEGNPANGVYCIKTGMTKLYKTGPEGKEYILDILGPREVLGMEAVFANGSYTATAEVIEEGTICFIARETLQDLIRKDCNLALKITHYLAEKLVESEEERLELAQMAVRERFARLLSLLAQSYGKKAPDGVTIDLKLSREEMAEMIGTAAETAMRLLKEFKDEKLVAVQGRQITVLNQEGLRKLSHSL